MAKITKKDVEYIAGLAHLTPDDATKESFVHELGKVLNYMDKLDELDISGIEPTMHALEMTNVYREDVTGESMTHEAALKNAPQSDEDYFLVPRILDTE